MKNRRTAGFTLIELLAVIAIIGILAGFVAVGVPRALERAKISDVTADFIALRNALAAYASDFGTFPPGYGYRRMTDAQIDAAGGNSATLPYDTSIPDAQLFFLENYMQLIGQFKAEDVYDRFSLNTHDSNRDNSIQLLEYRPVGTKDLANPSLYVGFAPDRYIGGNNGTEVGRMLSETGPYIYIPVNSTQAKRYAQYCFAGFAATGNADYINARFYDPTDGTLSNGSPIGDRFLSRLTFPPPSYDAYVLISVGPNENVNGVLPQPLAGQGPFDSTFFARDAYHILGLRAYFLATRDANDNGKLDFDFLARTREAETEFVLPDGTNEEGPLIFVQGSR